MGYVFHATRAQTIAAGFPDPGPDFDNTIGRTVTGDPIGLPAVDWSLPDRGVVNSTAKSAKETQLTCAALDALLPIPYGKVRVGGLIANAMAITGYMIFWVLWAEGPIDSFVSVEVNDNATMPTGVTRTDYLGAYDQAVDPELLSAFSGQSLSFAGQNLGTPTNLSGIAHSVFKFPIFSLTQTPSFAAVIKGRKVYDPRADSTNGGTGSQRLADTTTWAWSDCPTLHASDYAINKVWGGGYTMNWPSVITCANANDTTVGSGGSAEKMRISNLLIASEATVDAWMETMRAVANIHYSENMGVVTFYPDAAGSAVATYDHANGNIIAIDSVELVDASSLPTYMEVTWTDTTSLPWKDSKAIFMRTGVDTGAIPFRRGTLSMPWVTRGTQANREAIERVNKLWLRDMHFNLHIMDEGLAHVPGDIIAVTYPELGFVAQKARVTKVTPSTMGWILSCEKEDDNAYNYTVQAIPGVADTSFPLPNNPPSMDPVTVTEDIYQDSSGFWSSRIKMTWAATIWPFASSIRVKVMQDVTTIVNVLVARDSVAYITEKLPENLQYSVTVCLVSVDGTIGPGTTYTITNNGRKASVPTDIVSSSIIASEISGEVRLQWTPATDLDMTATEIRYGLTAGTWDTATLLVRVPYPQAKYSTKEVPPGTWRFWFKGLDSYRSVAKPAGQESLNASYKDVDVTSDLSAFLAGTYPFTTPSLFKMIAIATGWVSDAGTTWNTLFPSTMSTYTQVLDSYQASAFQSMIVTEAHDFGQALTGSWYGTMTYTDLGGNGITFYLDLNLSGGESNKTITAASNATPIAVTSTAHGYVTGNEVVISGVVGNTAANGTRLVVVTDADHYTLTDLNGVSITGNGAYTSGGVSSRWSWTPYINGTAVATARFARLRAFSTSPTPGAFYVSSLGFVRCTAVTREETGTITTSSSGPTVVSLASTYTKATAIDLTPQGIAARSSTYDKVAIGTDGAYFDVDYIDDTYFDEASAPVNTFDVYAWDTDGNQIAAEVKWRFRGI